MAGHQKLVLRYMKTSTSVDDTPAGVTIPLLERPRPETGESFSSYLIRLTEKNHYDIPSWILQLAGFDHLAIINLSFLFSDSPELSEFCRLCKVPKTDISNMLYPPAPSDRRTPMCFVFGIPLYKYYIRVVKTKICPLCLAEFGFAHRIWEIAPVTACPYHQIVLLDKCPCCNREITWYRKSFAVCQCGYDWRFADTMHAGENELGLTFLAYRACGIVGELQIPGMHVDGSLNNLDLNSVFTAVLFIAGEYSGKFDTTGKYLVCSSSNRELHELLAKAFKVFTNWPENFFRFLEWKRSSKENARFIAGIQKDFGTFYYGLYRILKSESYDFMRDAFEQYLQEEWNGGLLNRRYSLLPDKVFSKRKYVGKNEAAKVLKVSTKSVDGLIEKGLLTGYISFRGKKRLFLIEQESLLELQYRIQKALTAEQTWKYLGVGKKAFAGLVRAGVLVPFQKPIEGNCVEYLFDKETIDGFLAKISEAMTITAQGNKFRKVGFAGAAQILSMVGCTIPFLVQQVLTGAISPCGECQQQTGLQRFFFKRKDISRLLHEFLQERKCGLLSIEDAAAICGMKYEVISLLIKNGLLPSKTLPAEARGVLLAKKDIDYFNMHYITASSLARDYRTSPKNLVRKLLDNDIRPIVGREDSPRLPYIFKRSDLSLVDIDALFQRKSSKRKRKSRLLNFNEAMNILRIGRKGLLRLVTNGSLSPYRITEGSCRKEKLYFTLFDIERCQLRLARKDIVSAREAAEILGEDLSWFYKKWVRTERLRKIEFDDKLGKHFFKISAVTAVAELKRSTVTGSEAAKILGIHRTAVLKIMKKGVLKPVSGPDVDGFGCNLYLRTEVERLRRTRLDVK